MRGIAADAEIRRASSRPLRDPTRTNRGDLDTLECEVATDSDAGPTGCEAARLREGVGHVLGAERHVLLAGRLAACARLRVPAHPAAHPAG